MFFPFTHSRAGALGIAIFLAVSGSTQAQKIVTGGQPVPITILDSTKEQDGLVGPVRRVRAEAAKVELQGDKLVEGQRQLLEVTTYGPRGNRMENVSYPSASSPTGREEYKYDKGNIVEMTLRDDNGAVLSREAYSYEFDRFGNWTKMVTNLMVYEGGALKQEPVEITYRKLTYYFDDEIARIVEPAAHEKASEVPAATAQSISNTAELEPERQDLTDSNPTAAGSLNAHVEPATELAKSAKMEKVSKAASHSQPLKDASVPVAETETPRAAAESQRLEVTSVPRAEPEASNAAVDSPPLNDVPVSTVEAETSNAASVFKASASLDEKGTRSGLETPVESSRNVAAPGGATLEAGDAKKAAPEIATSQQGFEYFKAGRERLEAGDMKGAVAEFIRSIELLPDSVQARLSLGLAYLKLEKNKDALKSFKEAVRLNPDEVEGQYGLGLASFRIGRHKDAADAFKRATRLRPDMAKAHYGLALAYQELGKSQGLIEEFRILQTLDGSLARQLSESFPEANLPCSFKCK